MGKKNNISFKKRDEADEVYLFPVLDDEAIFNTKNSEILIEYQSDGTVLIIAGDIPGMVGYYKNYPDAVEDDEEKKAQYKLARCLLDEALDYLSEYDPETDYAETHSGNKDMRDIYVEVSEEKRDEVVLKMWKMLNYLRDKYIEFVQESDSKKVRDYPSLEDEIVRITQKSELSESDTCNSWREVID